MRLLGPLRTSTHKPKQNANYPRLFSERGSSHAEKPPYVIELRDFNYSKHRMDGCKLGGSRARRDAGELQTPEEHGSLLEAWAPGRGGSARPIENGRTWAPAEPERYKEEKSAGPADYL